MGARDRRSKEVSNWISALPHSLLPSTTDAASCVRVASPRDRFISEIVQAASERAAAHPSSVHPRRVYALATLISASFIRRYTCNCVKSQSREFDSGARRTYQALNDRQLHDEFGSSTPESSMGLDHVADHVFLTDELSVFAKRLRNFRPEFCNGF